MKKILPFIVSIFFITSLVNAQGQATFGIGFDAAFPTGDWADAANIGIGGTGRFSYKVEQNVGLTATFGYLYFGGDDNDNAVFESTWALIPVMAGFKYYFNESLFAIGELGVQFVRAQTKIKALDTESTTTSSKFGWDVGLGYKTSISKSAFVAVEAKYVGVDSFKYIDFRVGVDFLLE